MRKQPLGRTNADAGRRFRIQSGYPVPGVPDIPGDAFTQFLKHFSGRGQGQWQSLPIDQGGAHGFLQQLDAPAERRLAHVLLFGSP